MSYLPNDSLSHPALQSTPQSVCSEDPNIIWMKYYSGAWTHRELSNLVSIKVTPSCLRFCLQLSKVNVVVRAGFLSKCRERETVEKCNCASEMKLFAWIIFLLVHLLWHIIRSNASGRAPGMKICTNHTDTRWVF